jgi:hypothetical protein
MSDRKTPEAVPEERSEDPGTTWIKIPEAAVLLGMSERAARDWVKRHGIPQRGDRPVLVSEGAVRKQLELLGRNVRNPPVETPEYPGSSFEPIDVPYRISASTDRTLVPLDRMLTHVQGLSEQLAGLAQRNETLALEVGTLRERTATQERTISQLQAERDARLDPQPAEDSTPPVQLQSVEDSAPPVQPPQRPWWRFWART